MSKISTDDEIVEKKLGIPADYQYQAIRSSNFIQSNWHSNKFYVISGIISQIKAEEVLDLGTGSGNFELIFAKKLKRVVGVDYNDEAIDFLSKKLLETKIRNTKLFVGDLKKIEQINIPGQFDLIILIDVIEHLKITDAKKLVMKLRKFLKPNGYVCIITPNYRSLWILIEKLMDKFTYFPKFENQQHLAKFYKDNLNQLFHRSNFREISFGTFNMFSFLSPIKIVSKWLCTLELSSNMHLGNLIVALYRRVN